MHDNRSIFEEKFQINFMEELYLKNERYYFYVQMNKNVLDNKIEYVYYNNEDYLFPTLNSVFKIMNPKSDKCEIIGIDAYYSSLTHEIHARHASIKWNIPIIFKQKNLSILLKLKFCEQQMLYLGYFTIQDNADNANLIAHSYKDTLTGLFNRNTLDLHLENLKKDTNIYGIMLDIDYFKDINDTCGHDVGDLVLTEIGKAFIDMAYSGVIYYRYGGDEFFIQAQIDNKNTLITLLDEIHQALSKIHIQNIRLTCSMGVVPYTTNVCEDSQDLLKKCDIAMYNAKIKGRDCYHILEN